MAEGEETMVAAARNSRSAMRIALQGAGVLFTLLLIGLAIVWLSRDRIADNIIAEQIEAYDLPATYDIESIGPTRQVLANIVVGDPASPDLTVERVTVNLRYRFGFPAIGRIVLERPRLFGRITESGVTFGSLDPIIFTGSDEPAALPDLDLALIDGRARIDTPYGAIGIKAEGEGELDDGFAGKLAAVAPKLAVAGCDAEGVSVFGALNVTNGKPKFAGPVRLAALDCGDSSAAVGRTNMALSLTADTTLDGFDAEFGGNLDQARFAGASASAAEFSGTLTLRGGRIVTRHTLAAGKLDLPFAGVGAAAVEGSFRSDTAFSQLQGEWDFSGGEITLDRSALAGFAGAIDAARGTLAAPLLARLQRGLARDVNGGTVAGGVTVRQSDGRLGVVVPRVNLRTRGGQVVAALSRVQADFGSSSIPRVSGNISTGGGDIPRISGRMERASSGQAVFRLQMAPYEAAGSSLAFPDLEVSQARSGALSFNGRVLADGPLPGGSLKSLALPISGTVSAASDIKLWSQCTQLSFERLAYANLELDRRNLTLCPPPGSSILEYGKEGLKLAAGAPALDLSGLFAGTPITLQSGPIGFAWPGQLSARQLDIVLGSSDNAARFQITELDANLGGDVTGRFSDADIRLDAVPLNILQASGDWSYRGNIFALENGEFILEDRAEADRFNPLMARGATLQLADSLITAEAILKEPNSDQTVTEVTLLHNLSNSSGSADIAVNDLRFGKALQPVDLSSLALGVIANAEGAVSGTGRIDWNSDDITSSGTFSTEAFDFAAAFGPVKGATGTIVFTDLLNLTTAPGQELGVQSINPGIEVNDGIIRYSLSDGELLAVEGGSWPWLGGTLTMREVDLNFSREEVRRYIFEIEGVEAALFIERLELANISARGTFDGSLSVVFDEFGNGRIEDGLLVSRPPGGNLSYVGELTYEDMGAIANFAFQSLRSLDYGQMSVAVEGPLTGEILTQLKFEGVTQGDGAKRNFITRRLGNLPIRFNVNIRAPFYQLLTGIRGIYDPAYVRDPREIGLISSDGKTLKQSITGEEALPDIDPSDLIPGQPPIQDPESEDTP